MVGINEVTPSITLVITDWISPARGGSVGVGSNPFKFSDGNVGTLGETWTESPINLCT
jgi:hypothetical protein